MGISLGRLRPGFVGVSSDVEKTLCYPGKSFYFEMSLLSLSKAERRSAQFEEGSGNVTAGPDLVSVDNRQIQESHFALKCKHSRASLTAAAASGVTQVSQTLLFLRNQMAASEASLPSLASIHWKMLL